MKKQLAIALIGLGGRGLALLQDVFIHMEDVTVAGLCDLYQDRIQQAAGILASKKAGTPILTTNYADLLANPAIDAVIISCSWQDHIQIAIEAMHAKKPVACEVGGAYSVDQCWQLVHAFEATKTPCMMLENCCYGREELMVLNMVRQGIFGEIAHCKGGYFHDLRHEITFGKELRHYRLDNYINRNCENYPTHELGPIAKVLNLNDGNRMLSLVSMASKGVGLKDYAAKIKQDDKDLANTHFRQGDVVTTMIRCAGGETILLTLDTSLPQPYSRGFCVKGTSALYNEDKGGFVFDNIDKMRENPDWDGKEKIFTVEEAAKEHEHPLWRQYQEEGVKAGHGGMDWLVCRAFVESVLKEEEMPIDVYDMASWMCISALTESSISLGSQPVAIPDFTNGRWMTRKRTNKTMYAL